MEEMREIGEGKKSSERKRDVKGVPRRKWIEGVWGKIEGNKIELKLCIKNI